MKYTDEEIQRLAKDKFPGQKSVNNLGRQMGYVVGFKKAQELLPTEGTKPLSEITDEDFIEVAKYMGLTEGDFEIERRPSDVHLCTFTEECTLFFEDGSIYFSDYDELPKTGRDYLDAYDFLRSKGYILPTTKS